MMVKKRNTMSLLLGFAAQSKGKMILSVILSVVGVLCGMVPFYCIAVISGGLYYGNIQRNDIFVYTAIAVAAHTLKFLLTTFSSVKAHECAYGIMENIRNEITDKMKRVPLGVMIETPAGKLKALTVDTVEKMERPLAHILPEAAGNFFSPLCVLVLIFILDYRMGFASLAAIPVGVICYMGMMKDYKEKSKIYMDSSSAMDSTLVEYVNGIKVIKAFNRSAGSFEKFQSAIDYYHDTTLAWWKNTQFFSALGFTIIPSSLVVMLPVGASLFNNGEITFSVFVTCLILGIGISGPIMHMGGFMDNYAIIDASLNQIMDFLEIEEMQRPKENQRKNLNDEGFRFQNVCFGYHDKEVIHGISFEPVKGGTTAIVGPSGSGKSTVAKLMAGLWDVTSGKITYGGVDVKDIPFEQLMEEISFVSQDNFLFNISIRENIRMGNPEASDQQVEEAAKLACCHEFILKLQNGYDTLPGDAGGALSGGERQRITIARAMLKNAKIVILDEATAYADPENEGKIQQAIASLVKGKTLIVIAHRLASIKNADKIIVMENGVISGMDTHSVLLKTNRLYENMWKKYMGVRDDDGKRVE